MSRFFRAGLFGVAFVCLCTDGSAQWVTQSVSLHPGWNAVFLEVVPDPNEADAVFDSIPVESVWLWNRRFKSARFLADPESLLPTDPDWLVYFPPESPQASATSLHSLPGGRGYLIKLAGARTVLLTLRGLPTARSPSWVADSFNFVGFPLDTNQPPAFSAYFAGAKPHEAQPFYRLNELDKWAQVPADTPMRPGEAFWTFCRGNSNFNGPIATDLRAGGVLDFDRLTVTLTLAIRNQSAQERTIHLEPMGSSTPPDPESPVVAGPVPLSYFETNVLDPTSIGEWRGITSSSPLIFTLPPGGERTLRLVVQRNDMAAPPIGQTFLYQSFLKITDGQGSRILVPLRAQGLEGQATSTSRLGIRGQIVRDAATAKQPSASRYAGLWVGEAVLNQVSHPTNVLDRTKLERASGEFPMRIILHVDDTGKVRLLQQVTLMAKTENGETHLVLVTDDSLLSQFEGAFERDGALVGQRISTAAFPFFHADGEPDSTLPQESGGSFENGDFNTTETLQFLVRVPFDDPLNPFVHKYNPDHDNLDPNYEPWDPAIIDGKESWTIERRITLKFSPDQPGNSSDQPPPDWLATRVGGVYREEIRGVYRTDWNRSLSTPIVMGGRFELTQVSTVGVLNDGQ